MAVLCKKLEVPSSFSMEGRLYRPRPLPDAADRTGALAAAAQRDLELLAYPKEPFPYSRAPGILDAIIVGAGQAGLSIGFGLIRYGIRSIKLVDKRGKGFQGPWRTYARNHVLRTRKDSTGNMEWGLTNLHFRTWAGAKYGPDYYESIEYIPISVWAEYLDWYAEATNLPIQYETCVNQILWNSEEEYFEIDTNRSRFKAKFVVMAMGQESAGEHQCPPEVTHALPTAAYAHTMDDIPAEKFAGRDIVIIGGGASAFDTANFAMAAGARSVDMMIRRKMLPSKHIYCWGSRWLGFNRHYVDLPDKMKWAYSLADLENGVPPPRDTYFEAISDARFRLFSSSPIDALLYRNGKIVGRYGGTEFEHDFMVCGTANRTYIVHQPELKTIIPHIKLWKDAYKPHDGKTHPSLEFSPYLGRAMQFQPKEEQHSYVSRIFFLGSGGHGASRLSGYRCHLSGMQFTAPAICYEISKQVFLDHQEEIKTAFDAYDDWDE
ncbi:MAG TPA: NAD(P)/FAD-dependent oxidoreductase [Candidatus Binataceae bacterium]|nr:NAD(P)/FAD-dependent oxidoreductase [Candidatus Binataceae bacterium]